MNIISSYEDAFENRGDKKPIASPQDEKQAWALLNNEGNEGSWVGVVYVAKTGKWYTHHDAREIRAAMRAEERRVRTDSLPAG